MFNRVESEKGLFMLVVCCTTVQLYKQIGANLWDTSDRQTCPDQTSNSDGDYRQLAIQYSFKWTLDELLSQTA